MISQLPKWGRVRRIYLSAGGWVSECDWTTWV